MDEMLLEVYDLEMRRHYGAGLDEMVTLLEFQPIDILAKEPSKKEV